MSEKKLIFNTKFICIDTGTYNFTQRPRTCYFVQGNKR